MLPRQIAEASSKDELASFCFVVILIWFKIRVIQLLSAKEIYCIFETESFSEYTSQSKAVLSALLSAAYASAFLTSVDKRNG